MDRNANIHSKQCGTQLMAGLKLVCIGFMPFFWRRFLTCTSKKWSDQAHDVVVQLKILKVTLLTSVRIFSLKTCNCLEQKKKSISFQKNYPDIIKMFKIHLDSGLPKCT